MMINLFKSASDTALRWDSDSSISDFFSAAIIASAGLTARQGSMPRMILHILLATPVSARNSALR